VNPASLLFVLRVLGAVALLSFIGLLVWLIYKDMKVTAASLTLEKRPSGALRVVANENQTPAVDTIFPLLPITSIGRSPMNTIVLADGYASAEHALITRRHGQWHLQDQGSRNGTLLNNVPVTDTAVVSAGDIIAIGGAQLKIEL